MLAEILPSKELSSLLDGFEKSGGRIDFYVFEISTYELSEEQIHRMAVESFMLSPGSYSFDIDKAKSVVVTKNEFLWGTNFIDDIAVGNIHHDFKYPYFFVFLNPVCSAGIDLYYFFGINKQLFASFEERLHFRKWTTDWSTYFNDGAGEAIVTNMWTILNFDRREIIVVGVCQYD